MNTEEIMVNIQCSSTQESKVIANELRKIIKQLEKPDSFLTKDITYNMKIKETVPNIVENIFSGKPFTDMNGDIIEVPSVSKKDIVQGIPTKPEFTLSIMPCIMDNTISTITDPDNIVTDIIFNDKEPSELDYKYFEVVLQNGVTKPFYYHINNPTPTKEEAIGLPFDDLVELVRYKIYSKIESYRHK